MSDLPSNDVPEPILLEAERIVAELAEKPIAGCPDCEATIKVTKATVERPIGEVATVHEEHCPVLARLRLFQRLHPSPFAACRVCEPTVEVTDDQGVTVNAVRHETYCPFFR